MDGIVGVQQGEQQQQLQVRKEWRVVSSEGAPATSGRMSLAQPRQRFPGPATRPRTGRLYSESDNPNSDKPTKNGEEHGDLTLDGETHIDDLQHQLGEITRQREQLQQMELELQVRYYARNEILRLQASFDKQAKQHGEIVSGLQSQIQQREEQMQQMQQHSEERERQLQMETNEVRNQVWAKDALLREQTNELSTLRRERDNALADHKAEAAQLAEQLAEVERLKEQVHEKERRLQELEEQEFFFPNDKQLREAQLWMARSQELEAYHMNAMHAEIRERTEQITQMWANCQRQVAEVERYYHQIIQKLQQDLEASHFARNKEMTLDAGMRGSKVLEAGIAMHHKPPMMHMEGGIPMMIPTDGLSIEHATGLPVLPTPVVGMTPMAPVGPPTGNQYAPMQSGPTLQYHQPGQLQPVPPPVLIPQLPAIKQQLLQATSYHPVQVVQRQQRPMEQKPNLTGQISDSSLKAELDQANEQSGSQMEKLFSQRQPYVDQPKVEHENPSKQNGDFNGMIERSRVATTEPSQSLELDIRSGHSKPEIKIRDFEEKISFSRDVVEGVEHSNASPNTREQDPPAAAAQSTTASDSNGIVPDAHLLDKDSLLACLIRVIPAEPSAKIRISSTLPNRLAKVLSPLHWHDYRKHYGRLEDFVQAHSQLFVVDGDTVHLREGAHAIVSASTAVAKAAAAAATTGSTQSPTVALTPVAQPQQNHHQPQQQQQQQQRSRNSRAEQDKSRSKPQADTNGPRFNKNVNFKADPKRFKENGLPAANGYGNGYVNFNGATGYFPDSSAQEISARPQTQEGRILEAA